MNFVEKKSDSKGKKIGILTFHCSDNYGALLQAYALRSWLRGQSFDAEIVPYAPFYMTGRHWLIPYMPGRGVARTIRAGGSMVIRNFRILPAIMRQKKRMRGFRREALGVSRYPLRWVWQLNSLRYSTYVVGSDQIWNPAITCGLRRAYFGAFPGHQEKVISYAASIGSAELPTKHVEEFASLIQSVAAISVRESAAASFVNSASHKKVCAVPDPVLLLRKEEWEKAEVQCPLPRDCRYIFFHATEKNFEMAAYAKALADEKGMEVIELCYRTRGHFDGFRAVYDAGPAEFLAYIHGAEYVVSNSFHGIAMSVVYEKQCVAFPIKGDERVRGLLEISGLTERLYDATEKFNIDAPVAWEAVSERIVRAVDQAKTFLYTNLSDEREDA